LIEVRYQRGLYLPEPDLWLDPWDAKPRAFVSHAHADHFARHESAFCSDVTAALLRSRFRVAEARLESVSFHVPVIRNGFRLRLLPAGHISGSAMLHVTRISDNASLLYTGDFKTRRSRTAEAVNFLTADTLILETTFGLPGYEFPNPMEVEAEVLRFIDDCFSDGQTPVLLGYSLGKAQEALALLEEHGIPALLHPSAAAMTRACRDAGVQGLPEPVEFDGHAPPGHVVIAPPSAVRTNLLKGLKSKRTAMLSGWALQPGAKFRYRVDAMIPFSDHADHPGLMECIQRVRPRRVLTVHGFEHEFAAELRARQIDAWSAAGGDQMELPIQRPAQQRQQASRGGPWHKRVVCQLADFSDLCRLVTETGSRIAKTRFIASYLAGLEKDEDLRTAVNWLAAETPSRQIGKRLGVLDGATLRHALVSIPGAREERYREIHLAQKDLTRTARLFLQELQLRPDMIDLPDTASFILGFRESGASMDRIQQLSLRLASLHPAEGETLIKLLTGNLRLGIDATLVQEAIAAAFKSEPEAIAEAVRLTGDAGTTAALAKQRKLSEAGEMAISKTKGTITPDVQVTGELPFPPQ
jgi:DNA ligase 1